MRYLTAMTMVAWLASVSAAQADAGRVYLTFDDGPIDATLTVLDVLRANEVRATFFVNGLHLDGLGGEREGLAREALQRIIRDGHTLANHGYNHMLHDHQNPVSAYSIGAYRDIDRDSADFLPVNVDAVNAALGNLSVRSNNAIQRIARLPYSNNWRSRGLNVTCRCCTTDDVSWWQPANRCGTAAQRISNSAALAGKVADRLYQHGFELYGWDIDWGPANWSVAAYSETLTPAAKLVDEVKAMMAGRGCPLKHADPTGPCRYPAMSGKVVILSHDFLFENSARGRGKDLNVPMLGQFIRLIKSAGYRFDTLDHYHDQ